MRDRTSMQTAARLVGLTFLAVGIAGFIPGVTTNLYEGLEFAGHEGRAELLGIFEVSVLHNLVHVGFGLAGLALAVTPERARTFLIGGGTIYLGLWIYGLIIDYSSDANFVPLNDADNWLHFALGAGMLALGLALARTPRREASVRT